MSYSARVFRVLIASPSDVQEEREIAVRAIQEWNDLNSSERQVVLLPLRWETHSAPEYGKRPQEIINRQVVDYCDLLVGVFWTRIGSPTGLADSGTIEEIERVASQGKPIMLYFSQTKQDPDKIDLEQLQKLRMFKEKTFPRALVENFGNQVDFRDKLAKQLEIQIRELIGEISGNDIENSNTRLITDVQFHFANPKTGKDLGEELEVETTFFDVQDIDNIPDYKETEKKKPKKENTETSGKIQYNYFKINSVFQESVNKDYYRDIVNYIVQESLYRPIRFWIKNIGGIGARDVFIEIRINSDNTSISVVKASNLIGRPAQRGGVYSYSTNVYYGDEENETEEIEIRDDIEKSGRTSLELRSLQPQRVRTPPVKWFIGAKDNCTATIQARIYADTLAEPITRLLKLSLTVKKISVNAQDLIQEYLTNQQLKD